MVLSPPGPSCIYSKHIFFLFLFIEGSHRDGMGLAHPGLQGTQGKTLRHILRWLQGNEPRAR